MEAPSDNKVEIFSCVQVKYFSCITIEDKYCSYCWNQLLSVTATTVSSVMMGCNTPGVFIYHRTDTKIFSLIINLGVKELFSTRCRLGTFE